MERLEYLEHGRRPPDRGENSARAAGSGPSRAELAELVEHVEHGRPPPDHGENSARAAAGSGPSRAELAELVEHVEHGRLPPDHGGNSARAAAELELVRALERASAAVRDRLKRRGSDGPR